MELLKKHGKRHEQFTVLTALMLVVLLLYVVSLLAPMIWAFLTSFKAQSDFRVNINGLPHPWVWNYSTIFKRFFVRVQTAAGHAYIGMAQMYLHSILYAVGSAFIQTTATCFVAYACARFRFRFSKVIYTVVIVAMVLPIVGNMPSEVAILRGLGLFDTFWGMWVLKCNFLSMYFLVFYNGFRSMPDGYTEAAKVDGAGNFRILLQIVMPLVRNVYFTVMLILFIGYWNDYQVPLVYMPTHPTIAYGVYEMATTANNELATTPMRMTSAMLVMLPILAVFDVLHKRLLGNLTIGGLKG